MNQAQAIMSSGFDVSNLDDDKLNKVTHNVTVIQNEDGDPISGFIIVGKNSKEYQDVSNEIRKTNIQRAGKRSKQIDSSTDEGANTVNRTIAQNEHATALAVTVGWFGFNLEGQPMQFDKAMVEKMFNKCPQWQARVNQALDTDANFMKV
jgi:hypothetical protein